MPLTLADINWFLGGGAANADPNASLGGAISNTEIVDATDNNLFDDVSGAEGAAGDVEYRLMFLKNEDDTLTLQNASIYIDTNTPSGDSNVRIGLDPTGKNGTPTTIADEGTAPAGVVFSEPTQGAPLAITDLGPGEFYPVWVERTITAGAAAYNADNVQFAWQGETAA
ncbi:MAG: hypothetical protein ACPGO3_00480 [Magnetospiraceae bacterium]